MTGKADGWIIGWTGELAEQWSDESAKCDVLDLPFHHSSIRF